MLAGAAAAPIRVDLNWYTPGFIPQGIGQPNKAAIPLADEWQSAHPGRLIQFVQMIQTSNTEGEWLKTQLMGNIAPEIIHMNAEVAWPDVPKGWFVPLDAYLSRPTPYVEGNPPWIDTFQNQALVQSKRASDGKLYCITIDVVETGLFCNMTQLRKLGYEKIPDNWADFIRMLGVIKDAGIIPMAPSMFMGPDWGQDILFEMIYHDILPKMDLIPSRADAQEYLGCYLDPPEAGFLFTKGFFTRRDPRWREMYRILRDWRSYWGKELKNTDWFRLFVTQRAAIMWDGSWGSRRVASDPFVNFDWQVAYLPKLTRETTPYAVGSPASVIGGAAVQLHITNSAVANNTVEDCVDFLMFITAPKNMEKLAAEAKVFIPNVKGAKVDPQLASFQEIFRRHYCAMKWLDSSDGEYKKFWRRMLDYYLEDGVSLDDFLAMLESNFAGWVAAHRDDDGWDFDRLETIWREREGALCNELAAQ